MLSCTFCYLTTHEVLLSDKLLEYPIYLVLQEEQKKGKVHRIELWDKAHMKKDGRYANGNVQIIMVLFLSYDLH